MLPSQSLGTCQFCALITQSGNPKLVIVFRRIIRPVIFLFLVFSSLFPQKDEAQLSYFDLKTKVVLLASVHMMKIILDRASVHIQQRLWRLVVARFL